MRRQIRAARPESLSAPNKLAGIENARFEAEPRKLSGYVSAIFRDLLKRPQ